MRTFQIAASFAVICVLCACSSKQIRPDGLELSNASKGYSFIVPEGWRVTSKNPFVVSGPAAKLEELSVENSTVSLKMSLMTMQAAAVASGLCDKTLKGPADLEGDSWKGGYFVCRSVNRKTKTSSDVAMFMARHERKDYLFELTARENTWNDAHAALLSSLGFNKR